jgi:hypothetical protein
MTTMHFDQDALLEALQDNSNLFFTAIFLGEAIIKLLGLRPMQYFASLSNCLDFVSVVLSVVSQGLGMVSDSSQPEWLRLFQLVRVVRVMVKIWGIVKEQKELKGMRQVICAIFSALPGIFNIGGLLILLLFVFSVLARRLFWNVKRSHNINEDCNFSSFGSSLFAMMRFATLESWAGLMADMSSGECEDPSRDDGCGGPWTGLLFGNSFVVIAQFTLLNLFVAVLLDKLHTVERQDDNPLRPTAFADAWSEFDSQGTRLIPARYMEALMMKLGPPLGFCASSKRSIRLYRLLSLKTLRCSVGPTGAVFPVGLYS